MSFDPKSPADAVRVKADARRKRAVADLMAPADPTGARFERREADLMDAAADAVLRGIEALRTTIVFGMWSIIPYFIYLLSLWYFTGVMRLPFALAGAVGCWSLCAWLLIIGWSRFH